MRIDWNGRSADESGLPRPTIDQIPKAIPTIPRTAAAVMTAVMARLRCGTSTGWLIPPEVAVTDSVSNSSTISRNSMARSLIDCSRWSGLFTRQRLIKRRSSAGTSGLTSSIGVGLW